MTAESFFITKSNKNVVQAEFKKYVNSPEDLILNDSYI